MKDSQRQVPWLKVLRDRFPRWKQELRKHMLWLQTEYLHEEELTRRVVAKRTARDRAEARLAKARARAVELKNQAAEARLGHRQELYRRRRALIMEQVEQAISTEHGITVSDEDGFDIVRDIQWVYNSWGSLFAISETGTRILDEKVLKQAPSNGAIALANYALTDSKAFFDKYATKLIPKNAAEDVEESGPSKEEQLAELDPSFAEMSEYFDMEIMGD